MRDDEIADAEFRLYMVEARAELAHGEASAEVRWHEAVRDELVACTLGARRRPELRVDPLARIGHAIQRAVLAFSKAFATIQIPKVTR